jgi:hypothetical protein
MVCVCAGCEAWVLEVMVRRGEMKEKEVVVVVGVVLVAVAVAVGRRG